MFKRREMAGIYHTSHGHCNNRQTVLNLHSKGTECNHLKRYILVHRCDACDAALGRRHHKVKATTKAKRKLKSTSKTAAPVATAITTAFDSQIQLQSTSIWNSAQSQMQLIPLLQWHVFFLHTSKNPSYYLDIIQMRNMSDTAQDPFDLGIGEGATTSTNTTTPLISPPGTNLRMD